MKTSRIQAQSKTFSGVSYLKKSIHSIFFLNCLVQKRESDKEKPRIETVQRGREGEKKREREKERV